MCVCVCVCCPSGVCSRYGSWSTTVKYLPIFTLYLAEYLYWRYHFLPILHVITSFPTVFCTWSFSCWSWHSDNEISFDGKGAFGFSFLLKYCRNAILQLQPGIKNDTYIQLHNIIGELNVGDFVQKLPITKVFSSPIFHLTHYINNMWGQNLSSRYVRWCPKGHVTGHYFKHCSRQKHVHSLK